MSTITISIPAPLRAYTNQEKRITIDADQVDKALTQLVRKYPNLKNHLYEGDVLRQFVNVYLNNEDIRYLEEGKTTLKTGDSISIIPAIAGGS